MTTVCDACYLLTTVILSLRQHLGGSPPDDLLETSTAAQQRLEIVSFGTFLSVFALCGLAYFLLRLFIAIRGRDSQK